MPTAIDKIVDGFPFPTISLIVGAPNYETIAGVHLKLNSNATSVQSNLECGTLGLLHLTISPSMYATLSATAFVSLVNPGADPTIPSIASDTQITNLWYAHDVATAVFNEYDRTNKALHQMLIATVNKMFIRSLHHRYVGYSTTTTLTILYHLYVTYAEISSADLQDNDARLQSPYDANLNIEALINQLKAPSSTPRQGIPRTPCCKSSASYIIWYFKLECSLTNASSGKYRIQPTRPGPSSSFFATTHQELCESQATISGAGYHAANLVDHQAANQVYRQETFDAITNLVTATAINCASAATLTATNSTLAAALTLRNNKLVNSLQDVACLTGTISELCWKTGYQSTVTAPEVEWAKRH